MDRPPLTEAEIAPALALTLSANNCITQSLRQDVAGELPEHPCRFCKTRVTGPSRGPAPAAPRREVSRIKSMPWADPGRDLLPPPAAKTCQKTPLDAIRMPAGCPPHATDMPGSRHFMPSTCPPHATDMPATCHRHAIRRHATCHETAKNRQNMPRLAAGGLPSASTCAARSARRSRARRRPA